MSLKAKALFVHLLTASGAVFAMLAMLAAVEAKWSLMFLWLVVAFAVDGIYGPLARRYDVKKNSPVFDGVFNLVHQRIVGERHLKLVLAHPDNPAEIL